MPLAAAYEPDGMAQLASVDASADAGTDSSLAPRAESVDALTGMEQYASLTDAAAGIVACTVPNEHTVCMTSRPPGVHACLHLLHDACRD